jgi:hypothetical protein
MATKAVTEKPIEIEEADRPLDKCPTDAPPGCSEKVIRLRSRLEQGVSLFHPDDRQVNENIWQTEIRDEDADQDDLDS